MVSFQTGAALLLVTIARLKTYDRHDSHDCWQAEI